MRLEEKQLAVCAASQGQAIDLLRMRYGPGPCQHRCREAQLLCPNFYIDVYQCLEKMRTSALINIWRRCLLEPPPCRDCLQALSVEEL